MSDSEKIGWGLLGLGVLVLLSMRGRPPGGGTGDLEPLLVVIRGERFSVGSDGELQPLEALISLPAPETPGHLAIVDGTLGTSRAADAVVDALEAKRWKPRLVSY